MNKQVSFYLYSAAAVATHIDIVVLPEEQGKQIQIKQLTLKAGHASDTFGFYKVTDHGQTRVKTTAAYNATALSLLGDSAVNNYINGTLVSTSDYILYSTLKFGWRLLDIASLGAVATTITAATIDALPFAYAGTALTSTYLGSASGDGVVDGHKAYVVFAGDVVNIPVGSTTTYTIYDAYAGEVGCPLVVRMSGADAAGHYLYGTAEYVPV